MRAGDGEGVSRRTFLGRSASAVAALSASALSGCIGRTVDPRAEHAGPAPPREEAAPADRFGAARHRPGLKLALAGDTMLGRGVAEALRHAPPRSLFSDALVEVAREADLFLLNLECCISTRGSPWPDPGKPFFFRAPPAAIDALTHLGATCVTLANNHALDFGYDALLDTFDHLTLAGIQWVGAGPDLERARAPVLLRKNGFALKVVAATDHPRDFAARPDRPGVAFADLRTEIPDWLVFALGPGEADAVLLTPHWGPNMTPSPTPYVRRAAAELSPRATLVAGHSAHVFHGVEGNVLYDLGDFIDDYRVDPVLRNDLGLLFLVTFEAGALPGPGAAPARPAGAAAAAAPPRPIPRRIEAVPLKLDFCYTRLAEGDDAAWVHTRFRSACAELGTEVVEEQGRLVLNLPRGRMSGSEEDREGR